MLQEQRFIGRNEKSGVKMQYVDSFFEEAVKVSLLQDKKEGKERRK